MTIEDSMSERSEVKLKIKNGSKNYGYRRIFENISFELLKGKVYLLLGENGAGKSTLIKTIVQIENLDEGEITFDTQRKKNTFGVLNHELMNYDDLTIIENIRFFIKLHKLHHQDAEIDELLKEISLFKFRDQFCKNLSAGMLKRVSIAKLFLQDSDIIILDEPYSSLDQLFIKKLNSWLLKKKMEGAAILMTSHQIEDCYSLIDKSFILSKRSLIEIDKTKNIAEFNTAYLDCIKFLEK